MGRVHGFCIFSFVLLSCTGIAWAETTDEAILETPVPVLILPSAAAQEEGSSLELDLQPGRWRAKMRRSQKSDVIAISASRRFGSRGKTFAKWRQADGPATVEAGLECSLFGPDRWRASHRLVPTADDPTETALTKLSLGIDVSQNTSITFCHNQTAQTTEFGSGLSYKTEGGLEWGASLKARRLSHQEVGPFWRYPAVESSLRWTW